MVKLFDIQDGAVIPSEHCYTLKFLKDIMEEYPENYMKVYLYLSLLHDLSESGHEPIL